MNDKGWIKLHRQLQECPIWYGERFSKGQAWVDLLLLANHRDKKILFNGEMIVIKRGQYLTSTVKLAEKWGWNRKTVSSYLKMLENDKMIVKLSDKTKTLITIENYEVYQSSDEEDGQPIGQVITQPNGQPIGHQTDNPADNLLDINKNEKNEKNDKEDNNYCSEPKEDLASEPAVITLTLNDKSEYPIFQKDIDEWKELYPAVDVMQQLRHMKAWCDSNPTKRKTKRGVKRFITSWLMKEQDKGCRYITPKNNNSNSVLDKYLNGGNQ